MKKNLGNPPRGQTLVEFALILPVFLFLIIAIFDFGRAIYYYSTVHNAAREGARYGVIHPKTTDYPAIETRAREFAIGLGVSDVNVSVVAGPIERVGTVNNPTIKVTVSYIFRPITPFIASLFCGCQTITLSGYAVMRTEALP